MKMQRLPTTVIRFTQTPAQSLRRVPADLPLLPANRHDALSLFTHNRATDPAPCRNHAPDPPNATRQHERR